jgi:hypothetical protein
VGALSLAGVTQLLRGDTGSQALLDVARSVAAGGTRAATRVRVGITRRAGSEDLVFPCPDDDLAQPAPPSPPSPPPPPPPRSPRGHAREAGAGGDGAAPGGAGADGAGGQCGVGLGFSFDPAHGGLCVRAVAPGVATTFAEGDRLVEVRTKLPPARAHEASARRRCAKPPHDACPAASPCGAAGASYARWGGAQVDGVRVDTNAMVAASLLWGAPGSTAVLKVARAGGTSGGATLLAETLARRPTALDSNALATAAGARTCGVGVVLAHHAPSACFAVKRTVPGGAAEAAGLRAGDVVVAIGGTPLRDFPKERLPSLLLGPEGSEVVVAFLRPGEQRRAEVSLLRSVDSAKAQVHAARTAAPPRRRGREGRRNLACMVCTAHSSAWRSAALRAPPSGADGARGRQVSIRPARVRLLLDPARARRAALAPEQLAASLRAEAVNALGTRPKRLRAGAAAPDLSSLEVRGAFRAPAPSPPPPTPLPPPTPSTPPTPPPPAR